MRIGELAEQAGVSVRALRYYEEQGLLTAERSGSGQRHYAGAAVDRVRLIQLLYSAGLTSRTIADLLPCVDANVSTPESRARLAAERDRINTQIQELIKTRDRLDAVIELSTAPESNCLVVPSERVELAQAVS
ncbi:MerR family transcriptional regulator [Paractinoplanes abujensis]|uniref:DNA-binding transcriptional MerR regulator n=1 Tax=Paractinoplanes abujensis TaxID=882441 RepID=A0A7W7CX72_9ACTN|nr:MerR family transcriptional regulator [Actinoplanes abujensis]MBB4696287.1 DNA-binding transcriptional MerR regulator [Actinoplanes abujensis]GID22279.1 MerR family transcriptional regulator [Actinoplanes abujensis]